MSKVSSRRWLCSLAVLVGSTLVGPLAGQVRAAPPSDPPQAPINLRSFIDSNYNSDVNHDLQLKWADNPANSDTQSYLLSWKPGVDTPSPTDGPAETTQGPAGEAKGLTTGVVYTFAVRAVDGSGQMSDPTTLQASTRPPYFHLIDDRHKNNKRVDSSLSSTGLSAAATMQPDGHLRTVVSHTIGDYYASRVSAASGWREGLFLTRAGRRPKYPMFIDATKNRRVATAGTSKGDVWFRHRHTNGRWADLEILSRVNSDRALGVTGDASGREHVLMHRSGSHGGLLYFTRRDRSKWVKTSVSGTTAADVGLLSRDPVTNDVVLVIGHQSASGTTIRYAVLAPSATRVTGLRVWLKSGSLVDWTPSSVTSDGGRISLAVQRTSNDPTQDGPYVLWARGTKHHSPVRVRGTNSHDTGLVVTALQRDSVELSWRRTNDAWDPTVMGVYVARWHGNPAANNWSFTKPAQWTRSAYDFPVAAFRAADGHLYVTYRTTEADVKE